MSENLNDLFQAAHTDGVLSTESLNALNITDIGAQIQAGLGGSVEDTEASEIVLVTLMPDDSGSIRMANNVDIITAGHNTVLDTLETSPQKSNILIHNRYLNGHVLYPYGELDQAVRMDDQNYDPSLGTPLIDQTIVLLGTVLAKTQSFIDHGVPVRTVTLIITDGADAHSRKPMHQLTPMVKDMLRSEQHIIAGMGIEDGQTNFTDLFEAMGIPKQWILTPGNSQEEIRKVFQLFSQTALRASQSASAFQSLGGFGA